MKTLLLGFLCILSAHAVRAQVPYRFQASPEGVLISTSVAGKDGWAFYPGTGDPAALQIDVSSGSGSRWRHVRGQSSTGAAISRKNNARYAFPSFRGDETNAVSTVDIRYSAVTSGNYIGVMGLAHDGPDAGSLIDQSGELGPVFGFQALYLSGLSVASFSIRGAAFGTYHFSPVTTNQVRNGEWVRVRLEMNFLSGTGSLFYKNLSRRQTSYTPVPALQNIHLQLDRLLPACGPSSWDAMYLRLAEVGNFAPYLLTNLVPNAVPGPPMFVGLGVDHLPANGPFPLLELGRMIPGREVSLVTKRNLDAGTPWTTLFTFEAQDEYEQVVLPQAVGGEPVFLYLAEPDPVE